MIQIKKKFLSLFLIFLLLLSPITVKGQEVLGNSTDVVNQESIIEEQLTIQEIVSFQHSFILNSLTDYEKELICRITYLEAGNQSIKGQRAVIEVILNRILGPQWPGTVEEVLSAPKQFSTWKNRNKVSQEHINQINDVLNLIIISNDTILPDNSYVYFNCVKPKKESIKIQDQWFWR